MLSYANPWFVCLGGHRAATLQWPPAHRLSDLVQITAASPLATSIDPVATSGNVMKQSMTRVLEVQLVNYGARLSLLQHGQHIAHLRIMIFVNHGCGFGSSHHPDPGMKAFKGIRKLWIRCS